VTAPVALGPSGRYTVTWRVVSADGHPVADRFAFTLDRPAGSAPAGGSASGPCCGSGTSAGPGAAPASSRPTVSPVVWVLLGVGAGLVLVLLVVVAVVAVHLRRRPAEGSEESGRGAS
jgi:hypothetical protein